MTELFKDPFRIVVGDQVRFRIPPDAPCPCGSQRPVGTCCLTANGLRPAARQTSPLGPSTGFSRPGCYASILKDCSTEFTREHFVTKAILDRIYSDGDLLVSGLPWLERGEVRAAAPNTLKSWVLCKRHNNALGGLDEVALRLFNAIEQMNLGIDNASGPPIYRLALFNGHDIERWMLKVLCGLAVSGNLGDFEVPTSRDVPPEWIEVLFGARPFDPEQGLYVVRTPGSKFEGPRGVGLGGIGYRGRLAGLILLLNGYAFNLIMAPGLAGRRDFLTNIHAFRPFELLITDGRSEVSLVMVWDGPADNGTIQLRTEEVRLSQSHVLVTFAPAPAGVIQGGH